MISERFFVLRFSNTVTSPRLSSVSLLSLFRQWTLILTSALFLGPVLGMSQKITVAKAASIAPGFFNDSFAAFDQQGSLYMLDIKLGSVLKISSNHEISTVSPGTLVRPGDDPSGMAIDSKGNLYLTVGNSIKKRSPDGSVIIFAGDSAEVDLTAPLRRDIDGIGKRAHFNQPISLAVDGNDNLYVTEMLGKSIRKVTPSGEVTTIVGKGFYTTLTAFKNSAAISEPFGALDGIAVDNTGHKIFVSDMARNTILAITQGNAVSTLAGADGLGGNIDGDGRNARFNQPSSLTIDQNGNIYVTDQRNHSIRKVASDAQVSTLAATTTPNYIQAVGAAAKFDVMNDVAYRDGSIFVVGGYGVRKIDPDALVTTFIGGALPANLTPSPKQPLPPRPRTPLIFHEFTPEQYPVNCESNQGQPKCDKGWTWDINHSDYFICDWAGHWNIFPVNKFPADVLGCSVAISRDRKSLSVHCSAPPPDFGGAGTHAYQGISEITEIANDPGPSKTAGCAETQSAPVRQNCTCQQNPNAEPGIGTYLCIPQGPMDGSSCIVGGPN